MPAASYPYSDAPRLSDAEIIDPADFLEGSGPVELEIGPGRGGFIVERLTNRQDVRIFGLEIRRKWATLVDRRIKQLGMGDRGRVFAEDAKLVMPRLASASLSRIYVHFPDPWWKKRHQKRLVASQQLPDQVARLLVAGGDFFAQTDVLERAELYRELFVDHPEFEPWQTEKWAPDPEFDARSPRERRALEDQLPIYRVRFRLR